MKFLIATIFTIFLNSSLVLAQHPLAKKGMKAKNTKYHFTPKAMAYVLAKPKERFSEGARIKNELMASHLNKIAGFQVQTLKLIGPNAKNKFSYLLRKKKGYFTNTPIESAEEETVQI